MECAGIVGGLLPEFLLVALLRPEIFAAREVADAAGVGGLRDADALCHGHAGNATDVAVERPPAGVVPLLGLQRQREDLRHGAAEQRPPELRAERVVRDHDAAVRHHGRGHRGPGFLPPWPAGLQPAEVDLRDLHGLPQLC